MTVFEMLEELTSLELYNTSIGDIGFKDVVRSEEQEVNVRRLLLASTRVLRQLNRDFILRWDTVEVGKPNTMPVTVILPPEMVEVLAVVMKNNRLITWGNATAHGLWVETSGTGAKELVIHKQANQVLEDVFPINVVFKTEFPSMDVTTLDEEFMLPDICLDTFYAGVASIVTVSGATGEWNENRVFRAIFKERLESLRGELQVPTFGDSEELLIDRGFN